MVQRVEAWGNVLEFPDGMSDEDMATAIRKNEVHLNPDASTLTKVKSTVSNAVDAGLSLLTPKKSIADQAQERSASLASTAAPQVPGVPIRQDYYNKVVATPEAKNESPIVQRIRNADANDTKAQSARKTVTGALSSTEPVPEEGGFINSAVRTVGQGIKGAGRLASDFAGADQNNPATQYGQSLIDANPTAVNSLEDIAAKPGTAVTEATGNAAPSMAGMVGARAVGQGITALAPFTGPIAPLVAAAGQVVSWLGPAAIAALPSYGGIRDKQILNDPANEKDEKAKIIALLGAGAVGAIEQAFGPQQWAMMALTKEGRASLAAKFAATTIPGAMAKAGLKGAGIEGAEELAQNPIEQLAAYDNPTTPENIKDTLFGGAMGAIGGGVLGGGAPVIAGKPVTEHSDAALRYTAARGGERAKAAAQAELDRRAVQGETNNTPESTPEAVDRIIATGREKADETRAATPDAIESNVLDEEDSTNNTPQTSPQPSQQEQSQGASKASSILPEAPTASNEQTPAASPQGGAHVHIVLPDSTTLPAQWDVVDADSVKASLKEGVNQPRDRSRAASDIQVQGIANNPDYRRLSDSPVMDVGAPTLSHDGLIVGGNGRFEGINRAYDQGTSGNYLAQLKADAAAKGIDPAKIDNMKKPVLVRRITQPFDTRKLAEASNSGTGMQYSSLELAKIDAGRMKNLADLDVTDSGDITLTGGNIQNVRHALSDYNAAELGAMVDKDGKLSQEGIRRIRNAMLYSAFGSNPTLERLVESTDNDLRNISGALIKSAGTVARVRADIKAGSIPHELDISHDLVSSVEELSKLRAMGMTGEQYFAQLGMFGGGLSEEQKHILLTLEANIRSQKKLVDFIKGYYEAVSSIDLSSGDMFGNSTPTKPELLKNAKDRITDKQPESKPDAKSDSKPADEGAKKPADNESPPASRKQDKPAFDLKKQSEAELKAAADKQEAEKKKAEAEKKRTEAEEKKKREQKEIDSRQAASADNFELGKSAIDSLAGQGDIFSNPAPKLDYDKIQTRPGTTEGQFKAGRSAYAQRLGNIVNRANGSLLGAALAKDFREQGGSSLIGKTVKSPQDLAVLAQVFRDPRFETFRIFFTKQGKIVHHTGITSRLPGTVAIVTQQKGETVEQAYRRLIMDLFKQKEAAGADGYYLLHNHPSGRATPSLADKQLTREIANRLPGFKSHIVIDSNEYASIDRTGLSKVTKKELTGGYSEGASVPHDLLKKRIQSTNDLAELGKTIQLNQGFFSVIGLSAGLDVVSIAEIPLSILSSKSKLRLHAMLRMFARNSGATSVAVVSDDLPSFKGAIDSGLILDAISPNGERSARRGNLRPGENLYGKNPKSIRVEQSVFHGTPHVWAPEPGFPHGRPRLDKMGTGEGAQAFGWGWYSAENKTIGEEYRRTLSNVGSDRYATAHLNAQNLVQKFGNDPEWAAEVVSDQLANTEPQDANYERLKNTLDFIKSGDYAKPLPEKGSLYSLDIPDSVLPRLLDWDKPLSEQTPEVREAIGKISKGRMYDLGISEDLTDLDTGKPVTGGDLVKFVGAQYGQKAASEYLASIGIVGNRYLDGGSRADGKGAYNYVIWDQPTLNRVALLERNGEKLDAIREAAVSVEQTQSQPDTPAFKKWFGKSKVVDADGRPLVVYHGTAWNFSKFGEDSDVVFSQKLTGTDGTFFFTDDAALASDYAKEQNIGGENAHVMPVYLSLKNPLIVDAKGLTGRRATLRYINDQLGNAAEAGNDGLIIHNIDDHIGDHRNPNATIYVATKRTQIKSAIGNNGNFDDNNPSLVEQTPSQYLFQTFNSPEKSRLDDLIHALQDKHIDLKRVTEAIKATGTQIVDSLNAYLQEELFHGRTATRVKEFIDKELDPLIKLMRVNGVKMADFEEYLWARHAEERNIKMAARNPGRPDMQDGASGMKTTDARKYLANLDPKTKSLYEALAKRVDAMNAKSRQVLVNYGLESQKTINAWESMFQHYMPLMREDMDHAFGNGTGPGFSIKGNAAKSATGSKRPVVDILANIAQQREINIIRGEKNRVATALVGLAKTNPNPDFWKVDTPPTIRTLNKATGLVEDHIDPNYKNRDNVVVARIPDKKGNIQERSVIFNERDERALRMAQSLKNLDVDQLGAILNASSAITRYFSAINTQYNPIFGIVNLTRDVQGAMLNLTSTPLAGKKAAVIARTGPALAAIYQNMRGTRKGKAINNQWSQLWEEFQKEGGKTGFRDMYANAKARADALEKGLNPDWWQNTKIGKVITAGGLLNAPERIIADKAVKPLFDWLSDYNDSMENAVRLAAYKTALEQGLSKQQAASLAKNLTVNFNRKGAMGRQIGALYAFFNASVQGTARLAETVKGPAGKRIVAGGLLLGGMQAMLLAMSGMGDDEPPEFVKSRSLILPIGDGKYISVPMPLGFNVLPNMGRITTDFVMSGFKDPGKRTVQMMDSIMDAFNPIGNAGMSLQTFLPTVADPFGALAENKDFTGKPIARTDFNAMNPTPGFTRAKDTASAFGKLLAEGLNELSGGTKYQPGALSPTPDQIDYLISQATGGVGREYLKAEQTITAKMSGEELPPHKVPLLGRFYGDTKGSASQEAPFYEHIRRLNGIEAEIKGRMKNRENVDEFKQKHPEWKLIGTANTTEKLVQELRKRSRDLDKTDKPNKAELKKQFLERRREIMTRFNDKYKEAIK